MAAVARDAAPESVQRQMIDELSENKLAEIHVARPRQARESFRRVASCVQVDDTRKLDKTCENAAPYEKRNRIRGTLHYCAPISSRKALAAAEALLPAPVAPPRALSAPKPTQAEIEAKLGRPIGAPEVKVRAVLSEGEGGA
jgi:hypothetical protein